MTWKAELKLPFPVFPSPIFPGQLCLQFRLTNLTPSTETIAGRSTFFEFCKNKASPLGPQTLSKQFRNHDLPTRRVAETLRLQLLFSNKPCSDAFETCCGTLLLFDHGLKHSNVLCTTLTALRGCWVQQGAILPISNPLKFHPMNCPGFSCLVGKR